MTAGRQLRTLMKKVSAGRAAEQSGPEGKRKFEGSMASTSWRKEELEDSSARSKLGSLQERESNGLVKSL